MGRTGLSAVVVVLGLALVGVSVTAHAIGIGGADYAFGWEQKLGVAVGTTAAWLAGLHMLGWRRRVEPKRTEAQDIEPASVVLQPAA